MVGEGGGERWAWLRTGVGGRGAVAIPSALCFGYAFGIEADCEEAAAGPVDTIAALRSWMLRMCRDGQTMADESLGR